MPGVSPNCSGDPACSSPTGGTARAHRAARSYPVEMQRRVLEDAGVAGGEHEPVTVRPARTRRVGPQESLVDRVRERRERHRRAGMPGVRLLDCVHRERADRVDREPLDVVRHEPPSSGLSCNVNGSASTSRKSLPARWGSRPPAVRCSRPSDGAQLVRGVERSHLVRLGEGRVVEDGVDQVVDRASERPSRLDRCG